MYLDSLEWLIYNQGGKPSGNSSLSILSYSWCCSSENKLALSPTTPFLINSKLFFHLTDMGWYWFLWVFIYCEQAKTITKNLTQRIKCIYTSLTLGRMKLSISLSASGHSRNAATCKTQPRRSFFKSSYLISKILLEGSAAAARYSLRCLIQLPNMILFDIQSLKNWSNVPEYPPSSARMENVWNGENHIAILTSN